MSSRTPDRAPMDEQAGKELVIGSERIYSGRILNLRVDTVRLPSGHTAKREVVEHRGSVGIVALDADENILLVRQYRHPVGRVLLEIPAGTLEEDEDIEQCVRRELQEETGYQAGRIERLLDFYPTPGFCSEYLHIYLAKDLRLGKPVLEEDERVELAKLPLKRALELLRDGCIYDGKTIIGLLALDAQYAQLRYG
ncbi:MAG: NUDIX hydrolase [Chloroflexi bacterium]|nr:NUDIX hydrolase [Chloroflexota bacterium]MCL5076015.1 NUDIX hydrolase [Chloroflexota bacterium]